MRRKRSTVYLLTILLCLQTPISALAADVTPGSTQREAQKEIQNEETAAEDIESAAVETVHFTSEITASEFTDSELTDSELTDSELTSEGISEFTSEFTAEDMSEEAPEDLPEETSDLQPREEEQEEHEQEAALSETDSEISNESVSETGDSAHTDEEAASDGVTAEDVTEIFETETAAAEVQKMAGDAVQMVGGTGWRTESGKKYYYAEDGTPARGVTLIGGYKYLFDSVTGELLTGLARINGETYYGDSNGKMLTGWYTIGGKRYYFTDDRFKGYTEDEEGKRQIGFIYVGDDRYYLMNRNMTGYSESDFAAMATGWQTIGGYVYYMDPMTGVIATGFTEIDGKLYYLNKTGSRPLFRNEWRTINEKRYYFNDDYTVQRGISTISGSRYYLDPVTGEAAGGFKTVNGRVYYFADEKYSSYNRSIIGLRLTGFNQIGGKTYFFTTSSLSGYRKEDYASMATGWQTINGKRYHFEANGVMDTGWHTIDGYKYHFTCGVMDNAWKVIASKTYHFTDGKMDTGWKTICDRLYYFHSDGHKQETGREFIDGKICAFDRNGICTSKSSTLDDVVKFATKWVGKIPYKSSATNTDPNGERKMELKEGRGSDCSWFVFNCLAKYGYLSKFVHSYEWGSKPSCYSNAKEIGRDISKLKPGDIICYAYGKGERAPYNSHVSIYIGDGKEVHCADGRGVIISYVQNSNIINIVRFSN